MEGHLQGMREDGRAAEEGRKGNPMPVPQPRRHPRHAQDDNRTGALPHTLRPADRRTHETAKARHHRRPHRTAARRARPTHTADGRLDGQGIPPHEARAVQRHLQATIRSRHGRERKLLHAPGVRQGAKPESRGRRQDQGQHTQHQAGQHRRAKAEHHTSSTSRPHTGSR